MKIQAKMVRLAAIVLIAALALFLLGSGRHGAVVEAPSEAIREARKLVPVSSGAEAWTRQAEETPFLFLRIASEAL